MEDQPPLDFTGNRPNKHMEDRYTKYFNLSLKLFFTFLAFIITFILVLLGLRLMFGLLDQIPWFVLIYMLFIVMVPAALFISIFLIYFRRTKFHPSAVVRAISYTVFSIALVAWAGLFVMDLIHFFKKESREIGGYYSYNIFLLTGSVVLIFLVGILQALSTAKEKDWMAKREEREQEDE
jgi:hypothetical protein